MNLYLANGRYVGTQAEARKLDRNFRPIIVPVDKDGLIAYLNGLAPPTPSPAASPPSSGRAPIRSMGATAVLSRSDNPDLDVDSIVETICNSGGYALKRFAGAVAVAFQNIAKGG